MHLEQYYSSDIHILYQLTADEYPTIVTAGVQSNNTHMKTVISQQLKLLHINPGGPKVRPQH